MKKSQRQHYAERIERVLAHLEASDFAEEAPSLDTLAAIAAMSPFHFHRIFRLMTGETLGECIRRLRLARSLPELRAGRSVTAASGASGYGSSQSFARALRGGAGTTATRLRADPQALERLAAELRQPDAAAAGAPLSITIVDLAPFRLLAQRNVGDYAELNRGYAQLFEAVLASVPADALQGIYGIPYDDPRFVAPADCRFDCALAVGNHGGATDALREVVLGGGEHLRLRYLGNYDALHSLIDQVYGAAIAGADRAIGEGPLFFHYLDDPEEVAEADLRSDIYLPLA